MKKKIVDYSQLNYGVYTSEFQSQSAMPKIIPIFLIYFQWRISISEYVQLLFLTCFENFYTILFSKMASNFWRLLLNSDVGFGPKW